MKTRITASVVALVAAAMPAHAAMLIMTSVRLVRPKHRAPMPSSRTAVGVTARSASRSTAIIRWTAPTSTDDFTLSVNSSPILQLSYDLGGGGGNSIFTNVYGATASSRYSVDNHWAIDVSITTLPLFAGSNSFIFAYVSPSGDALGGAGGHAGPQGLGDEGWGLTNVLLTGNAAAAAAH